MSVASPNPIRRRRAAFALAALAAVFAAGLAAAEPALVALPPHPDGVPWPTEQWAEGELPVGVDADRLEAALEDLFASRNRAGVPDTRAVLFVHGGRIVFERYAPGFDRSSRFQSWSMAKSVTNAFVGMVVKDGHLELDERAPVESWAGEDDPRRAVTLRHLLQMRSGLGNADGFGQSDDMNDLFVSHMLFGEGASSPAAYATHVPLVHPVGERWAYSTGTSILLAKIAGQQVGQSPKETLAFLRARLFDRIGMRSAQPEFAKSGEFVGGAFVHANARDWARFGYLYLRDGTWEGKRLLPEGWVDFARTRSPAANNGIHGAHFWVNRKPSERQWVMLPGLPESAFVAEGAMFQMVAMLPTMDLVAVRLGESIGADHMELRRKFARVIDAFPEQGGRTARTMPAAPESAGPTEVAPGGGS